MSQLPPDQALQLALAHHQAGRLPQAESLYRQILAQHPRHPDALHLLGVLAHQSGHPSEAVNLIRQAIELLPNNPAFHSNLGVTYAGNNQLALALACQECALALRPNYPEALTNLGLVLTRLGRPDEALAAFRQAAAAAPADPAPLESLADLLHAAGRNAEAFQAYQAALRLAPQSASAWCGLGHALKACGQPDQAIDAYHQAIKADPNHALAQANLGFALRDRGQIEEAIAALRAALRLDPALASAHSNLIITLYLQPHTPPETIAAEKRLWDLHFARPLASHIAPHLNDPSPDRRLRIGYVSPDFREHPVGRLMLRILQHHDRAASEIFCYSNSLQIDDFARRLQQLADQWRPIAGLDDSQFAQLVRADRIDILVDLAMHTINSRILAFARKPAPVQISYLAYADGSGLSTIDYRLTDPYLDPLPAPAAATAAPAEDAAPCERPLHLPDTYWCYAPAIDTPPVNALPALAAGHLTFGALNDFCKVTHEALELWAKLLHRLPTARLILHVPTGSPQKRVAAFFQSQHIALARLEFPVHVPIPQYFAAYQRLDIALAAFPYAGGTTLCDALWMGVPPISLAGPTSISRAGLSVLSNVGLPHLVARSPEEHLEIAVRLASDLPALAALRQTLRERLQNSPLGKAPQFAQNLESAYRQAWHIWCQKHNLPG